MEVGRSVDCLILGDHILLLERLCVWLPRNRLGGEDIFLEKALLDEPLYVSLKGPTMDNLLPPAVMIGVVLLQPRQ